MTKALYRKYRPKTLAEVVGQEQVTGPLSLALKQGKLSHAYLFVGPRGCGKTSVARILAHEVNGFDYEIEDDYVDIVEIDGASNRGIDNIRELREKAAIAPTRGKYKIYIIDEVHMLTKEAFNALLKTLEEPPAHVIFIMATTDAYKVPVTITSRAQTYTFNLASQETMFDFLQAIARQENIKIDDAATKVIAKRGGGSFRDSLSLLDQISTLSDQQITEELVVKALGLPQDEKIQELLACYKAGDLIGITTLIKALLSSGIKAETLAEEITATIIETPQPEFLALLAKLPEVRAPFAEAKLIVALAFRAAESPKLTLSEPSTEKKPTKASTKPAPSDNTKPAQSAQADFSWEEFLNRVRDLNEAVYAQLAKTTYKISGDSLEIYPQKRITKTILSRDNNRRILMTAASDKLKIIIREVDEKPDGVSDDAIINQISDIMGGEVQSDGGGDPFEN
ncbi:DNA polymerase III subunit gamma/tau [Candidatus Saccharibacteria bacterium]|nr:DNA polymerase III subunit gamma/tau [Candidatus Saccharibacteria bacterium]